MVARAKGKEAEAPARWLDEQLRDTKARLHKVEGELEQALKVVWSLEADVKKLMGMLASSGSVSATVQGMREELRQLRDHMGRIQDRQAALANNVEEMGRRRQVEGGRERPELGVLAKQTDVLERNLEHMDGRLKAIEEVARHVEEEVAGFRLTEQTFERTLADISTRAARALEAALRLDQQLSLSATEREKLQREDEALSDKLRLLLEQTRRWVERLDKLEALATFPEEAKEMLKSAAFERDQLIHRMASVERLATEVAERAQEFVQGIARLDQRSQTQASELLGLSAQLLELREQTKGALKRVFQMLLRQRRRQAETVAQEIKELSQGELHSGD